jgi:HEAT repeat protein
MSTLLALVLSLGMVPAAEVPPPASLDPARLRELLLDRLQPESQNQAALLLVQSRLPEAEKIVRWGLRQTGAPETFAALAAAVRLCRDRRFQEELFTALTEGRPAARQAVMETLAVLADAKLLERLESLADDPRADIEVRYAALWTIGQTGTKAAAAILVKHLTKGPEDLRTAAVEILEQLTGEPLGNDVARWQAWWQRRQDAPEETWLRDRLLYQAARSRRLEGELQRTRHQVARLEQQLYARMTVADRLGHVPTLVRHDNPAVRGLAVAWCVELYPAADTVGQQALVDTLLQLSRDPAPEVQRPAVLALGRVTDGRAFDRLQALIRQAPPSIRAAAAHALALQALGSGSDAQHRKQQVVPLLQKALDDVSLEVVVEAAEGLGVLGVPEAGPVLAVLLGHPSRPVRQTAAQALERVADATILENLLRALDDSAVAVRFSLVGALGHVLADGRGLTDAQRSAMAQRLQQLMLKDTDPGVRSRAATVLGQCNGRPVLTFLWQRVQAAEDRRVQEKAWLSLVQILSRSDDLELLTEWDHRLAEAHQNARRAQLLTEVYKSAKQGGAFKGAVDAVTEMLVQAHLAQGKWSLAFPLVRELLNRPGSPGELERRLQWLLTIGKQALDEGNPQEALRAVQEAQPFLTGKSMLAADFDQLKRRVQP